MLKIYGVPLSVHTRKVIVTAIAGIFPVGLNDRQSGGGLSGTTGTTGTISCGRSFAIAVTMTLRVWTESGTP